MISKFLWNTNRNLLQIKLDEICHAYVPIINFDFFEEGRLQLYFPAHHLKHLKNYLITALINDDKKK
jgi:hypothetical protein